MSARYFFAGFFGVLAFALMVQSASARASHETPFSAELALTSDYRFKGQSQSDRSYAIQGYVSYVHDSGAFVNVWASTGLASSKYALTEIDPTLGYTYELSDHAWATISASYFMSRGPSRANDEYFEAAVTYTRKFRWAELSAELSYSPDYSYHSGHAWGITSGAERPLRFAGITWLTASAHFGYQWIDNHKAYGTPNWIFYDLGLTATWKRFALDVRFAGTNTEDISCFGGSNLCDGGMALTLSASI